MERVLPVPLAVLHKLKLFLLGFPVLFSGVIPALALGAGEGDKLNGLLLRGHALSFHRSRAAQPPRSGTNIPKNPKRGTAAPDQTDRPAAGVSESVMLALERNRTVDLILTMDMLCQLSYKGIESGVTVSPARAFVKANNGVGAALANYRVSLRAG